ncbi:MAG: hypothetical protein JOZ49_05195 [Mycolicibacterium sp.]|nr:hypothetical protein [Mycolicibacterium sp.]
MTAAVTVAELPGTDECLCCRNGGVLPTTNTTGLVDRKTVLRCCKDCIVGLFLDGLAGWAFLFDTDTVRIA